MAKQKKFDICLEDTLASNYVKLPNLQLKRKPDPVAISSQYILPGYSYTKTFMCMSTCCVSGVGFERCASIVL